MAFRACPRKDDPFERRVRETYGANVVRAPREGIDPLTTVARQDDRWSPAGICGTSSTEPRPNFRR
jgi:hypothetical protein